MIYVIQIVVVLAVWFANIRFGGIENPYAVGALAIFAAWLVTMLVTEGPFGLWRWLNRSPLEDGTRPSTVASDSGVATQKSVRDILPKQ